MTYNQFCEILCKNKLEFYFEYDNNKYWIIVNDKFRFLSDDGLKCQMFISAKDLLEADLFDKQKLKDIWIYIEVLSFEYGWDNTIDINFY